MTNLVLNRKENAFDFLRLFAAFSVVIGHSTEHLKLPFLWHQPADVYWFYDGVPMFFIISGLLVYKSCEKCFSSNKKISHYLLNRYLRIAPAIYFYLVITVFLFILTGVINKVIFLDVHFYAWIISTFILAPVYQPEIFRYFGVGAVNGSLWTIPAEFSFYIILPLILLFERKTSSKKMLTVLSVVAVIFLFITETLSKTYGENTLFKIFDSTCVPYLLYFGLGIYWSKAWDKTKQNGFIALGMLVIYVVIRFILLPYRLTLGFTWTILWTVPFSYLIIWFGYNAPRVFTKITNIGDLSYGVYIWHMVIVNFFLYYGITKKVSAENGTMINLMVIVLTGLCALVSWWCIEKPFLKLKPYTSRTNDIIHPKQKVS